ncbi:MAG: GDP-L-fucose synthase [Magnetococcales bacterium]|nr:GDP-L-fucose synthase [Magnetococcales bacterium]
MDSNARIYVAGHRGLVGSAIVRRFRAEGFNTIITRTHSELDLTRQVDVERFFTEERPEYVVLSAAKVGGIHANNTYPADFIGINLMIQSNIIDAAWRNGVEKLLFLGSACVYPKECQQPIKEEYLLTAPLEPTNEPYALAKIAGISLCDSHNRQHGTRFQTVMPNNLYGPNDNFHLENAHVLPALIRKFHDAKLSGAPSVEIWGTGKPRREFLHVDDMADACLFIMKQNTTTKMLNIGTGSDVTIRELAETVQKVVGFEGALRFDTTRPDGTMKKLLDSSRLHALGWQAKITLQEGVRTTYQWFLENQETLRG